MATTDKTNGAAPLSLVTKLAQIMGKVGNVEKKGFNKAQNYPFAREADVAAAVTPLLAEAHIFLHQTVTSHERVELYKTQSGNVMWLTIVSVQGTWIDGDTGEKLDASTFIGYGADTGDKGIYKALTGAEKYFLMKSFLISTGDDPEADEKVDKAVAAAGAAQGVRVSRGAQQGVQRGGKSSIATAAQVTEIAKQARDLGLDADSIVPVIASAIGSQPAEGQSIRDWLGALTSEQAGKIIAALSDFKGKFPVATDDTAELDAEGKAPGDETALNDERDDDDYSGAVVPIA